MLINGNETSLSTAIDDEALPTFSPARHLRKAVRNLHAPASAQDTNKEEWDGESPSYLYSHSSSCVQKEQVREGKLP